MRVIKRSSMENMSDDGDNYDHDKIMMAGAVTAIVVIVITMVVSE